MKVSFEGIGEQVATFEAETTGAAAVKAGSLVKLTGNGKVGACSAANDIPAGVALSVRDGYAAVQVKGYVQAPCASGLTAGWKTVASDANGKLAAVTSGGRGLLVVHVDSGVCGILL